MTDVVALGEILIDFTPVGKSEAGNIIFERNPGGAPANVAAAVSRLGGKSAFMGKAGDDIFGHFLKETLDSFEIQTSGLKLTPEWKTTLAFIQLDENGDRSFSFYRDSGADISLSESELDFRLIDRSKIFHFGSLSLTHEPVRGATKAALKHAGEKGLIISYDPNLRPLLWQDMDEAKEQIVSVMDKIDILKVSEEELEFITGENRIDKGIEAVDRQFDIPLVLVTMGADGSVFSYKGFTGRADAFKRFKAVDTTGAGDAFTGAFLYSVACSAVDNLQSLDIKSIEKFVRFSNAAASICVTKKGAIPGMPDLHSVEQLLAEEESK